MCNERHVNVGAWQCPDLQTCLEKGPREREINSPLKSRREDYIDDFCLVIYTNTGNFATLNNTRFQLPHE